MTPNDQVFDQASIRHDEPPGFSTALSPAPAVEVAPPAPVPFTGVRPAHAPLGATMTKTPHQEVENFADHRARFEQIVMDKAAAAPRFIASITTKDAGPAKIESNDPQAILDWCEHQDSFRDVTQFYVTDAWRTPHQGQRLLETKFDREMFLAFLNEATVTSAAVHEHHMDQVRRNLDSEAAFKASLR